MAEPGVPLLRPHPSLTFRRAAGKALKSQALRLGLGAWYANLCWMVRARKRSPWLDWNYQKRAVFVHVPKNAGTNLYRMLDIAQPRETHCTALGYRSSDPDDLAAACTYAVCRNPWDRFVSAFHYLIDRPISDDDNACSAQMLGRLSTFGEFAEAIEEPSCRSTVLIWRHFSPQWYFVSDLQGRVIVDHIFRFEALDDGVSEIGRYLAQKPVSVRENVAPRRHYSAYYTERLKRIVSLAYARDSELFGYSFEDKSDVSGSEPAASGDGL